MLCVDELAQWEAKRALTSCPQGGTGVHRTQNRTTMALAP